VACTCRLDSHRLGLRTIGSRTSHRRSKSTATPWPPSLSLNHPGSDDDLSTTVPPARSQVPPRRLVGSHAKWPRCQSMLCEAYVWAASVVREARPSALARDDGPELGQPPENRPFAFHTPGRHVLFVLCPHARIHPLESALGLGPFVRYRCLCWQRTRQYRRTHDSDQRVPSQHRRGG
jgi:hypothetical protein